jgi:ATP-binding cassette subfamily B protein
VCGADRIIVIDKGRVAQIGAHEELLAQGDCYGDMWRAYTETASWHIATSEKEAASLA